MLQPAFGRPEGTDVRVMLGKPHLIIDRTGASAVGNQAVQQQIGLWFDMIVGAVRTLFVEWFAPIVCSRYKELSAWAHIRAAGSVDRKYTAASVFF